MPLRLGTSTPSALRIGNDAATRAYLGTSLVYDESPSIRNLFQRTEEFDNSYWTKNQTSITANAEIAPDSTTTADKLIGATNTGEHLLQRIIATNGTDTQTLSCYAKASGYNFFILRTAINSVSFGNAVFNLSTGAVVGSPPIGMANIQDVGSGWYRCSWSLVRGTANGGNGDIAFLPSNSGSIDETHNGIDGVLIWGAQLEAGGTLTAYQRVV